jgi:hypothetical protein
MKRTKLTDFILKHLRWTGIFLWEQIYFNRLSKTLEEFKNNLDVETISRKNNDVIKSFSKEILGDRTLYKVEVV